MASQRDFVVEEIDTVDRVVCVSIPESAMYAVSVALKSAPQDIPRYKVARKLGFAVEQARRVLGGDDIKNCPDLVGVPITDKHEEDDEDTNRAD